MPNGRDPLDDALLRLAVAAGHVANYCDHVEHNELAHNDSVRAAGAELRSIGLDLCETFEVDAILQYATRLRQIEARNVLSSESTFDGQDAASRCVTWRDLQLVQAEHDRVYHADVVGLTKSDQLRHYALHLSKLAGSTAAVIQGQVDQDDWLARRVPDVILFGLKLATVSGEKLVHDDAVPRLTTSRSSAGAIRGVQLQPM